MITKRSNIRYHNPLWIQTDQQENTKHDSTTPNSHTRSTRIPISDRRWKRLPAANVHLRVQKSAPL